MLLVLISGVLLFFSSCEKEDLMSRPPKKMKITGITLDSAYQISNPMSFLVKVQSSTVNFQTTLYNLPFSDRPWYPAGVWQGLNETFDVSSEITISVFFQLPGNTQLFPLGNYSVFKFRPDNKMGNTLNSSPSFLSFVNSSPGVDPTKVTLSVIWE